MAGTWERHMISVFDMFTIGIGPSSSHTVGPMRAAGLFVAELESSTLIREVTGISVELHGSLAATGVGHGTPGAVLLGLEGTAPETVDPDVARKRIVEIERDGQILLAGNPFVLRPSEHIVLMKNGRWDAHPNMMTFHAWHEREELLQRRYYSVGGGFVIAEGEETEAEEPDEVPYPFSSGADLLEICRSTGMSIAEVVLANELSQRSLEGAEDGLARIWTAMQQCVSAGISTTGVLPGGLSVPRRAALLHKRLLEQPDGEDPLRGMDWLTLYALAVNEENAAGGRVVTAPTNGAAGVIPAVLHYYDRFVDGANAAGVRDFLLTAAAIGSIIKQNASISGAEVGCQGEIGSACSMAAAGMAAVLGGTPEQVENAAEIGMEHNLGLTCDPIAGLVQIPCIERNAIAAVKAVAAARTALHGDGKHIVTLDKVIATMRQTGADMQSKYKETSLGGLAVNIIEC